ncbi:hypothetical protein STSP2_00108 [Anaerohalosphaera lusitana]|uniref:Uncharacterized protein n=1 Tax=Anaerohalosphaera lusitana TaxID=1936003 RepID=A0A1U9NH89_9BACT|nr:hypothetical protein [Anaerohalosphaera lusitana]AQT66970.1 hypothetical protein STSP2_00108 [Anaerohalosphaera lusitana]
MVRKLLAIVMIMVLGSFSITGCGGEEEPGDNIEETMEEAGEEMEEAGEVTEENLEDAVDEMEKEIEGDN